MAIFAVVPSWSLAGVFFDVSNFCFILRQSQTGIQPAGFANSGFINIFLPFCGCKDRVS